MSSRAGRSRSRKSRRSSGAGGASAEERAKSAAPANAARKVNQKVNDSSARSTRVGSDIYISINRDAEKGLCVILL